MRLLPLLFLLPLIELWLLIKIGSAIGALTTIVLLVLAGIAGSLLLRVQGVYTLWKVQERLQRGDLPAEAVFDGLLLAVAGVLLFIPGFITDALALLLLVPTVRRRIARHWLQPAFAPGPTDVIDGEWRRVEEPHDH